MTDYEDTPEEIAEERITNLMRELDECKAKLVERSAKSGDRTAEARDRLNRLCALPAKDVPCQADIRAALEEIKHFHTVHKWCHPTHGKCCTCQACGLDYDSCRCDLDEQVERAEAAEAKVERLREIKEYAERTHEEMRARIAAFEAGQKPLEGDARSRILRRLGVADVDEALAKIDSLGAKLAEAQSLLDSLKTEAGKAAFALANGWPLPEEVVARKAEVERLKGYMRPDQIEEAETVKGLIAEVERLREALNYILEVDDQQPGLSEMSRLILVKEIARRAALRGGEEHSKHPTGDYCVYCLSQWPCVEAGEQ